MNKLIYVSRGFVEFGPFDLQEIAEFKKRGIIADSDHLLIRGTHEWIPAHKWTFAPTAKAAKPEAKTKNKAPARKKATTKKQVARAS